MFVAILGRNPDISVAELESKYGSENVNRLNDQACKIKAPSVDIHGLGGVIRVGLLLEDVYLNDWFQINQAIEAIVKYKHEKHGGKITLGVSFFGERRNVNLQILNQEMGKIKASLKKQKISTRFVPNNDFHLNIAQFRSNKLNRRDKKLEVIILGTEHGYQIIESVDAPDIDSYTKRDRSKPFRDAKNGMLPPQLAMTLVNLTHSPSRIQGKLLDPFCGSGTLLIEARLLGRNVYGSDLNPAMIKGSQHNMKWADKEFKISETSYQLSEGDATALKWPEDITSIACETYLGPVLKESPKITEFAQTINEIDQLHRNFLKNIYDQIKPGARLALAIPAWRARNEQDKEQVFRLPLVDDLEDLGYNRVQFKNIRSDKPLLYLRNGQFVARDIIVVTRK